MDVSFDSDSKNENISNIDGEGSSGISKIEDYDVLRGNGGSDKSSSSSSTSSSTSAGKKGDKSSSPSTTSSTNITSSAMKYVILALLIITLIAVIIYICYKTYKTQINNLGSLLETSRKEEAILHSKLKASEQDKQLYIQKINQLNNDIQNQYTPILPMTNNSYDAPDPDAPREKPKLLKDKEAIKAFVNSKRQTVQDELDERQAKAKEEEENMINETQDELLTQTKADKRDEKVDEIMEIIQSQ